MTDYLTNRECLRGLILLMDIRHPLTEYDLNLIHWSETRALPLHILLTKADKLKRGPALAQLDKVQDYLKQLPMVVTAQTFSTLKRQGIDQAHFILDTWLAVATKQNSH